MTLFLRADRGDVNSHRNCEIPTIGPGLANCLVTITGLAESAIPDTGGLDVFGDNNVSADVEITTDYHLAKNDNWLRIVASNLELLAATYVSLASIAADDEDFPGTPSGFVLAINDVFTRVNEEDARSVVIHLKVGLQGDSTIAAIAYQANILIQKVVD